MTDEELRDMAEKHFRRGRLVEAGWIASVRRDAPEHCPEWAIAFARAAFFYGVRYALHVGNAATKEPDERRQLEVLDQLLAETEQFAANYRHDMVQAGNPAFERH